MPKAIPNTMSKAAGRASPQKGRLSRNPAAILKSENGDVNYFSTVVFIFIAVLLLAFILDLFSIISTQQELDHCADQMVKQIQLSGGVNGETEQLFNFLCSQIEGAENISYSIDASYKSPTVNRAKPSAKELLTIFEGHIADGTLALCDGLRSYHALPGIADCIVKDCNDPGAEDTCFYNLNTVNGFHSFIKQRYVFYRGVASKYINRYNALFSAAYRNAEGIIKRLVGAVLAVTGIDYYHSNRDVRESGLLAI